MSENHRAPGPWRLPRPSLLDTLARLLARHRRALAALAAGLAVASAVGVAAPAPPPTRSVVVAARPVAAGSALTADDVRVARFPDGLVPADAVGDPAEVVGRPAVVALGTGTPVTGAVVVSPSALRARPGHALVPVRLADPQMTSLVRVGDRVDVLAMSGEATPARIVARGARVAALPSTGSGGSPFGGDDTRGPALLFEVESETAPVLAQAGATTRLGIVLRS
ncbi:hypothetical protein GCM10027418_10270 [Mariniluteicoccus endophyticus]